jgi:hypothetical protein
MTDKDRKARSDSAAAAIDAALAATQPYPDPPAHIRLRDEHMPFWDAIVRERARKEWTTTTLVVAAQLTRCQFDIERETELLESEGTVLEKLGRNESVLQYANPRVSVLEQLARREMALMRALGITGVVANGDKRNVAKGRQLEREAGQAREEAQSDDLLA